MKEKLQVILNALLFRKGNSQAIIEGVQHWIALRRLNRTQKDKNELFGQYYLLTFHI